MGSTVFPKPVDFHLSGPRIFKGSGKNWKISTPVAFKNKTFSGEFVRLTYIFFFFRCSITLPQVAMAGQVGPCIVASVHTTIHAILKETTFITHIIDIYKHVLRQHHHPNSKQNIWKLKFLQNTQTHPHRFQYTDATQTQNKNCSGYMIFCFKNAARASKYLRAARPRRPRFGEKGTVFFSWVGTKFVYFSPVKNTKLTEPKIPSNTKSLPFEKKHKTKKSQAPAPGTGKVRPSDRR